MAFYYTCDVCGRSQKKGETFYHFSRSSGKGRDIPGDLCPDCAEPLTKLLEDENNAN